MEPFSRDWGEDNGVEVEVTYLGVLYALSGNPDILTADHLADTENRATMLEALRMIGFGLDVPIHSFAFGNADTDQLQELSEATIGRMFTAGNDLAKAHGSAKRYS